MRRGIIRLRSGRRRKEEGETFLRDEGGEE
jgi:hypothetical protein